MKVLSINVITENYVEVTFRRWWPMPDLVARFVRSKNYYDFITPDLEHPWAAGALQKRIEAALLVLANQPTITCSASPSS